MITPSDLHNEDIKKMNEIYGFEDLNLDEKDYERIIESTIDSSMKHHHCDKLYEEAIVYNPLPMHYIRKIASKYINAGWEYIYVSVSDNITSFKFSDTEIIGLNAPHKVYTANSVDIYEP